MQLLAPLLCLMALLAHINCTEVVGIIGENFTFPVQMDQRTVEIVWKRNRNKVVEWEGLKQPTYFGALGNRSVLTENGSLTIVNLEKDDAGVYVLQYWDSVIDQTLSFLLVVLDSLPEPEISCNTSNGKLVLNCTAHFQRPLNFFWNFSNNPHSYQNQVLSISLENVDATTNATCTIKLSQMERRSEISLNQCLPEEKGSRSYKRNHDALIVAFVLIPAITAGILVLLCRKGIIKLGRGRKTAQNKSPVNGSGEDEQHFLGNSQQEPNSEGAAFSHAVHCKNEEPEEEQNGNIAEQNGNIRNTALNEDDNALKDKQILKNGVNQEDTLKTNSSLLGNHDHADDHGINKGEVTQDAEGENGDHLSNSSSCK